MPVLPNPFIESAACHSATDDAAATSPSVSQSVAAADLHDSRFVLDQRAFMEALEEPPLFLRNFSHRESQDD